MTFGLKNVVIRLLVNFGVWILSMDLLFQKFAVFIWHCHIKRNFAVFYHYFKRKIISPSGKPFYQSFFTFQTRNGRKYGVSNRDPLSDLGNIFFLVHVLLSLIFSLFRNANKKNCLVKSFALFAQKVKERAENV